jgi:uncharacterized caspase-like protein
MRFYLYLLLFLAAPVYASDNRNLVINQTNNMESDRRIALVIGNSAYINSPLKNPSNDARDVAQKLRALGFDVIERNNLQTRQIGGILREFRSKLVPGAVALVFYAGHGLQIKGVNYLPAVDADINSEEDVPNQSLAVNQIMDVLDESRTRLNLVFLDACRNNPYASRSFRSTERGLARVSAPSGTLISYATKPGSVAADGDGRNGLYTSKLLVQMDGNLQIEQTLKRVVAEVKVASQGKQEPWMEGSIEGEFCFRGCVANGGSGAQPANQILLPVQQVTHIDSRDEIEQETWDGVRESGNAEAIQEYLKQYPRGKYATLARIKIKKLQHDVTKQVIQTNTNSSDSSSEDKIQEKLASMGVQWSDESFGKAVLRADVKVSQLFFQANWNPLSSFEEGNALGHFIWRGNTADPKKVEKIVDLFISHGVSLTDKVVRFRGVRPQDITTAAVYACNPVVLELMLKKGGSREVALKAWEDSHYFFTVPDDGQLNCKENTPRMLALLGTEKEREQYQNLHPLPPPTMQLRW